MIVDHATDIRHSEIHHIIEILTVANRGLKNSTQRISAYPKAICFDLSVSAIVIDQLSFDVIQIMELQSLAKPIELPL